MSELSEKLTQILTEKEEKIIPENIKKDVQIFDIIGEYEGEGGSGEVKLFETIGDMELDEDKQEGDLALVYGEELQNLKEDSIFSSALFPSEVELPEMISDTRYASLISNDSVEYSASIELGSNVFVLILYINGMENMRVEYTSEDGILYVRSDGGEETINFGANVHINLDEYPDYDENIGYFIQIYDKYFNGVYQCGEGLAQTKIQFYTMSFDGNKSILYNNSDVDDRVIIDSLFKKALRENTNLTSALQALIVKTSSNTYSIYIDIINSGGLIRSSMLYYDGQTSKLHIVKGQYSGYKNSYRIDINTSSNSYTFNDITASDMYHKFVEITNSKVGVLIDDYPVSTRINKKSGTSYSVISGNDFIVKSHSMGLAYNNLHSQLDAISDYVYKKTFYGKNGVETGILGTEISGSYDDKSAEVYATIQAGYDDMDQIPIMDASEISRDIYIVPMRSDGLPLYDTNNLYSMSYLFADCRNLVCVSFLETYNVTEMISTFENCVNLKYVATFDTTNTADMTGMFNNCPKLTERCLDNILVMCRNSVVQDNKTLANIGLTQEQAEICMYLESYQDFISAGWETGYEGPVE